MQQEQISKKKKAGNASRLMVAAKKWRMNL